MESDPKIKFHFFHVELEGMNYTVPTFNYVPTVATSVCNYCNYPTLELKVRICSTTNVRYATDECFLISLMLTP